MTMNATVSDTHAEVKLVGGGGGVRMVRHEAGQINQIDAGTWMDVGTDFMDNDPIDVAHTCERSK